MIRVERTRVRDPTVLRSSAAEGKRERARKFFRREPEKRAQESFDFGVFLYEADEVRAALDLLFSSKCAYCEQPLALESLVVDQFRPRSGAVGLDGSFSLDHYWWLAYEWTNLYSACPECSSLKGPRFPVEGERLADPFRSRRTKQAPSPSERALLLDPCVDDPEKSLVFLEDGHVVGAAGDDRGRVTVEVLGLNRRTLIDGRLDALATVRADWDQLVGAITSPTESPSTADLEALFDTARPFAGLRRQFLSEWAEKRSRLVDDFLGETPEGPSTLSDVTPDAPVHSKAAKRAVRREFDVAQTAQESYSVEDEAGKEAYFIRSRMIERVVIHNLKIVKDLELLMPAPVGPQAAAWLTLLGENGCGKSTVLQAVGLALMGQDYRETLGLDASTFVRRRARSGFVEVYLAGNPDPIRLDFEIGSRTFTGTPAEPKVLLLGYGATRLLPRADITPQPDRPFARADNLFNPFVPLGDATSWLLGLDDDAFPSIARTLRTLLLLDPKDRIERHGDRIEVAGVPLEYLSDGFQSVLALAADVMAVMISRWPAMEAAEGIVLIDELGAHLHPRWRMRVVDSLRGVFPRVQFLVSTHDPLCLRGLKNGEVVVMRLNEKKEAVALTDVPPVEGLRVDQLLTSECFGMYSTIDPTLDQLFDEYYLLKAKPRLTKTERERLAECERLLEGMQVLGTTRRERIVLEAADDFLAKERRTVDPEDRQELKDEAKQKIVDLWERVAAGRQA
jgi:uncharacterized protein (TIGR02646 family)